jgi:ABC-type thiamin/hydroxymethylpyrimidine transport system permease subunit
MNMKKNRKFLAGSCIMMTAFALNYAGYGEVSRGAPFAFRLVFIAAMFISGALLFLALKEETWSSPRSNESTEVPKEN